MADGDTGTLDVPETGERLAVVCRSLPLGGTARCEIVLDAREHDEITHGIADGTWRVPMHYALARALVRPGDRVLDLGGHIGTFALLLAAHGCRVLAVEASPRNAALLRASALQNGFADLQVAGTAVGAARGTVRFLQAGPYGFVVGADADARTITVPVTTVDRLLADVGWDRVDLVKMDIEGSEVAALRGMTTLLGHVDAPPIVFESNGHTLHLLGETPGAVRGALAAAGYRCFLLRPGRLVPVTASELQPECNVDYLALRGAPLALDGWAAAPPMTESERLALARSSCAHPNAHMRAYIARALADASPALLGDAELCGALDRLVADPIDDVRAAAEWWAVHRS